MEIDAGADAGLLSNIQLAFASIMAALHYIRMLNNVACSMRERIVCCGNQTSFVAYKTCLRHWKQYFRVGRMPRHKRRQSSTAATQNLINNNRIARGGFGQSNRIAVRTGKAQFI